MRLSLRVTVTLVVLLINVVVFGAGLSYLTSVGAVFRAEDERNFSVLLAERVQHLLDSKGDVKASGILRWPRWNKEEFEDAVIVRLSPTDGEGVADVEPRGVFLNPLGSRHRTSEFDTQGVLRDITAAIRSRDLLTTVRGISLPVYDTRGRVWGGCWFRPRSSWTPTTLMRRLLPWFGLSTLLLTLGTVFALRRLVLDPVQQLAGAAGSMARGDLTARLPEPTGRDEISELMRGFNSMATEVQGFNARLASEVELATDQARRAEAILMTQRRLAATGELAAGIAHEINNPLGGMLNALESLERADLPTDRRTQYRQLIRSGLERIRGTVGRVLRLAPRPARMETVGLSQPIADAVGLVRHRAEAEGVRVLLEAEGRQRSAFEPDAFELFDSFPAIQGESNELGQAVLNLLVNSLDALESEGGSLRIELARDPAGLKLSVHDDGPGLDPETLERAPDPFFTTKDPGKGTGLGLAIVHNVVHGHGGRVTLVSQPGEGCTVELTLPLQRRGDGA